MRVLLGFLVALGLVAFLFVMGALVPYVTQILREVLL